MATVMVTCRVQVFIQFDGDLDDDGYNKEYSEKKNEFLTNLEKLGMVDVESEDDWS